MKKFRFYFKRLSEKIKYNQIVEKDGLMQRNTCEHYCVYVKLGRKLK